MSGQQFPIKYATKTAYKVDYNKAIGKGSYAEVYKAVKISDQSLRAIKVIKCDSSDKVSISMAENEARLLVHCDHPNIIKSDGMFKPLGSARSIVLEYCIGGDLEHSIMQANHPYTEAEARTICLLLLKAIAYLHENNIVHADIKPQNILLTTNIINGQGYENSLRLTDFGFSAFAEENVLTHLSGSPPFRAPELVDPAAHGSYGKPVDMWAFGVTVFYLLSGKLPFSQLSEDQLHYEVLYQPVSFPNEHGWENVSYEAKEFIKKLLDKSMHTRLTASQALQDPWFTEGDSRLRRQLSAPITMIETQNEPKLLSEVNRYFYVQKFLSKFKIARKRKQEALQALLAPPIIELLDESIDEASPDDREEERDTLSALPKLSTIGRNASINTGAGRRTISVAGSGKTILAAIDMPSEPYPMTRLASITPLLEDPDASYGVHPDANDAIAALTATDDDHDHDSSSSTLMRRSSSTAGTEIMSRSTSKAATNERTLAISVCSSLTMETGDDTADGNDDGPGQPFPIVRAPTLVTATDTDIQQLEAITSILHRYKPHEWEAVRHLPVRTAISSDSSSQISSESYLSYLPAELACVKELSCDGLMVRQLELEQLLANKGSGGVAGAMDLSVADILQAAENEVNDEDDVDDVEYDGNDDDNGDISVEAYNNDDNNGDISVDAYNNDDNNGDISEDADDTQDEAVEEDSADTNTSNRIAGAGSNNTSKGNDDPSSWFNYIGLGILFAAIAGLVHFVDRIWT